MEIKRDFSVNPASGMSILIVTPVIPPAIGGGAFYTEMLVQGLLRFNEIDKIAIVTEKYPGCPSEQTLSGGRLHIKRLFPFRCGVVNWEYSCYLKYIIQNIQFLLLKDIVSKFGITHVMIHNYFYNYFSLMEFATRPLINQHVKLIADFRDPRIPEKYFHRIYIHDKIICCSENIVRKLSKDTKLKPKLTYIPIIVDVHKPSISEIEQCKARYGLQDVQYIFNSSGVYHDKGTDLALDIVQRLQTWGENFPLVIAGRKRDWSSRYQSAADNGTLRYLGAISHNDVLSLSAGASLYINLSRHEIDSMPRASLEAIAVGAKVLLPPGVPEFDRSCPEFVARSSNIEDLAKQTREIIGNQNQQIQYDLHIHSPDSVIPQYIDLFMESN